MRIIAHIDERFDKMEPVLTKVLHYLEPKKNKDIIPASTTDELEELSKIPDLVC